jgi:hypothetical protein
LHESQKSDAVEHPEIAVRPFREEPIHPLRVGSRVDGVLAGEDESPRMSQTRNVDVIGVRVSEDAAKRRDEPDVHTHRREGNRPRLQEEVSSRLRALAHFAKYSLVKSLYEGPCSMGSVRSEMMTSHDPGVSSI